MRAETRERLRAAILHTLEQAGGPVRVGGLRYEIGRVSGRAAPQEELVVTIRRELEAAGITREYRDTSERYNPIMVVLTGAPWIVHNELLDIVAEAITVKLDPAGTDPSRVYTDIRVALARIITAHGGAIPDIVTEHPATE